jgi:hypothetical protein
VLTSLSPAQHQSELSNVLSAYGIRPCFTIKLENSGAFFPGELARTEFVPSDSGQINQVVIHYNGTLYREILHYEVGHIKLRCMELPIFYASSATQPFEMYYLALHGELYDWLLTDQKLPTSAEELMREQIRQIPPPSTLLVAAQSVPPVGTLSWHQGMPNFIRVVVNKVSCLRSNNLQTYAQQFDAVVQMFAGTNIAPVLSNIETSLMSLPNLSPNWRNFSSQEKLAIVNAISDIYRLMVPSRLPEAAVNASIQCSKPFWRFW